MAISKENILKTIDIAQAIINKDIAGIRLPKGSKENTLYHSDIRPKIEDFKKIFGNNPQIVLGEFIQKYIEAHNLSDDYEKSDHQFYGHVLNSHAWSCVIKKDEAYKELKHMQHPQLYILINSGGIKFGFCYGTNIKNDDPVVEIVRNDEVMQQSIFNVMNENNHLIFSSKVTAELLSATTNAIHIAKPTDIQSNWSNDTYIINQYDSSSIPDDIELQIESTFDLFLNLFKAISELDPSQLGGPSRTWASVEADLGYKFDDKPIDTGKLYFKEDAKKSLNTQVKTALSSGKHIILIGPPGTGKSKLASMICESYCNTEYKMTTATSDWSTYETIGGYRPREDRQLEFKPGVILQCWQDRSNEPINKWLIIDEINRADIDKAL